MACLFSLFKLVYVILSVLILMDHFEYIYKYLEMFKPDTFFSNNQFAHTMGMFLGLLFRISGLLSAIKEKITLSTTYGLFLLMILLLMTRMDHIFYLYLGTAIYAFVFVIVLKYRRSKERKARARSNRALVAQQQRATSAPTGASQVAVDLSNGASSTLPVTTASAPSAPPYEFAASNNNNSQPGSNPNFSNELYFNPQHNTPPPSYSELYETK